MTDDQIAYNRRTAIRITRERLGLMSTAPSEWTYEQRIQYNKELAAYIAANPQAFSPDEVAVAGQIERKALDPLDDVSLMSNLKMFGDEFLVEAEKTLNVAGNTIQNGFYLAVVVAVSWYMVPLVWKSFFETGIEQKPGK